MRVINAITTFALGVLCLGDAVAQRAEILQRVDLGKWGVGTAQFSGIVPMGNNVYAVVSDKEPTDGFFKMRIEINNLTGTVWGVGEVEFLGNPSPTRDASGNTTRDCEDVVFQPSTGTIFISGEGDQQVLEYSPDGTPTGRALAVPSIFATNCIYPNMGFEALAFHEETSTFYTMTEGPLKKDGTPVGAANPNGRNLLRLQSYSSDLSAAEQYAYRSEGAEITKRGTTYTFGVSAMTALTDGRLLVMERELNVPQGHVGATCIVRIFRVDPRHATPIAHDTDLSSLPDDAFLNKTEVFRHTTRFNLTTQTFANYEGMCLGTPLADGTPTLLLISDSQGGYGNSLFRLKDYLLILALRE